MQVIHQSTWTTSIVFCLLSPHVPPSLLAMLLSGSAGIVSLSWNISNFKNQLWPSSNHCFSFQMCTCRYLGWKWFFFKFWAASFSPLKMFCNSALSICQWIVRCLCFILCLVYVNSLEFSHHFRMSPITLGFWYSVAIS